MDRDALPQVDRDDVGSIVVGEWVASDSSQQRAAVAAAAAQWQRVARPTGLLTHTAYASEDGTTVLHYSQAVSDDAFHNFTAKPEWAAGIDAAAPGIERRRATPYRLSRSIRTHTRGEPGCIVTVLFDAESVEHAEAWVEAITAAGMLSAHLHISLDGRRILNYAEWADADSHKRAVEARPQVANSSSVVNVVDETPGVHFAGVTRYLWWRTTPVPA